MGKIKRDFKEFVLLLRNVPAAVTSIFVLSVLAMNLLANKSINLPFPWLALDCGILLSWVTFLTMDVVTKHFGPKAATQLSLFAVAINLAFCLVFFAVSVIPGVWSQSFVAGSEDVLNNALDKTFGGTWYIVLGSTAAFCVSAIINNFTNWGIGKAFKKRPDCAGAFVLRSYVSTAISQFADNLLFAFIVSYHFFGWSVTQCLTCATTGMIVELLCEATFSYLGYALCKRWKRDGVGQQYFDFVQNKGDKI